jgi:hypothetical protein
MVAHKKETKKKGAMDRASSPLTTAFISTLVASGMIFIYHKIDRRFEDPIGASCDPSKQGSWMCRFPGLIVSHKPWSAGAGIATSMVYFSVAVALIVLVSLAARRAAALGGFTWYLAAVAAFSLLWFAWGAFETHHLEKTVGRIRDGRGIKRGTVPAWLFTSSVMLVFTPVAVAFVLTTLQSPASLLRQ